MNVKIATSIYFSLLLAAAAYGGVQESMLKNTAESKYKVGQVWSYKTRPVEKNSTFIVLKVQTHPKVGNIVHVALRDLKLRRPDGGFVERTNHLPFAEESINKSAVKLLKEKADLLDYEDGYGMWREAFDAGKVGV